MAGQSVAGPSDEFRYEVGSSWVVALAARWQAGASRPAPGVVGAVPTRQVLASKETFEVSDSVVQKINRPERTVSGPWLEVIASNLDHHRATFLWKCEGLSEAQLRLRPAQSSALTLLGLMRHLQGVERAWFQRTLAGTTPHFFPYRTYVTADGGEWFDESDPTPAGEVYEDYLKACQESRQVFAKVTTDLARIVPNPEFGDTDVRFVLAHVIEECARHVGHADLLREAIDGATGE